VVAIVSLWWSQLDNKVGKSSYGRIVARWQWKKKAAE